MRITPTLTLCAALAAGNPALAQPVLRDIGAMLSEYNYYASPNAAAEENLDEEFLSDPAVYPPQEVLENLQFIRPVGEMESEYQRLFDEVKSAPAP